MEVWPVRAQVGECPFWDVATNSLFWVDIRAPSLHQFDGSGARLNTWHFPEPIGAFALLEGASAALVALKTGIARFDLETGRLDRLFNPEPGKPTNRLNEGKVSPCGRYFVFGSMDDRPEKEPTGALYCLSSNGRLVRLAEHLIVANGVAWSPNGGTLYFSDSRAAVIWTAAWRAEDGTIGPKRDFARLDERRGRPDGATVDAEGCYWSAGVSASRLNRFSPNGELIASIELPVHAPTMPVFGGPELRDLFITSHRAIGDPHDQDGAVVVLRGIAQGVAHRRFQWTTA